MGRRSRRRKARPAPRKERSSNATSVLEPPLEDVMEQEAPALTPDTDRSPNADPTVDAGNETTFGGELRRQRELRKITLREVSESTKINLRYLEALENNDFTDLPGGAFTIGYVRAFARCIGVEETSTLDAYR